jgi:hypothetical protein
LRSIVSRVEGNPEKLEEIEEIKNEVGEFLLQMTEGVSKEAEEIGVVEFPQMEINDEGGATGYVFDEVRGFDLGKDILKRMTDNQVALQGLSDMARGQGLEED